jgi:hypothetical protein
MQMLGQLGHECTPHHDKLGVLRYRAAGLKLLQAELPK